MSNKRILTIGDSAYMCEIQGEGEALVLFHGFTGSRSTWDPFINDFKRSFKVMTLDLPGHGETTTRSPRTMKAFCDDFAKVLNELNIDMIHLIGYSMGGRIALSFAFMYPEKVASLVLESASPGLRTEKERKERMERDEQLSKKIVRDGLVSFVNHWQDIPLFASQKILPKNVQKNIRNERLNQSEKGLAESLLYMGTGRQPSWWDELHLLEIPIFLIVGEWDQKFIDINNQMKNLLPAAQLTIVEQAGHAVHIEQPEKFVKLVLAFINKIR